MVFPESVHYKSQVRDKNAGCTITCEAIVNVTVEVIACIFVQCLIIVIADVGCIRVVCPEERLFIHSHGWSHTDCFTPTTGCSV